MGRLKGQANLQTYLQYLKDTGIPSSRVITGRFYTYSYMFDKSRDFSELKFYDVYPLVFVYKQRGQNFMALNFHHIPPKAREIWLSRARFLSGYLLENDRRVTNLTNFNQLYNMFKKASTASVRQYKKERVRHLRRVEAENLDEIMKFISNTYFGISVPAMISRYKLILPYK